MSADIPVLHVEGTTLPEAWEKAFRAVFTGGMAVRTEYDAPSDPPSRDCTMVMVIHRPMAEPRIHRAFPGGLDDLEIYRQEVVDGVHDHWIDPAAGKWTYTYHQRLFCYPGGDGPIDQIELLARKLAEAPHTRRAQAITWCPEEDPHAPDPPCLQRMWWRAPEDEDGGLVLNLNCHWRSRDAFKAAFMNIFALTDLQARVARRLAEMTGRPVSVGRYVDVTDSFHIYGKDLSQAESIISSLDSRSFEEKTWTTADAEPFFEDGRRRLAAEKS